MAIASLVLGIVGCIPFITGLLAVVFGIVGIRKTREPYVAGRGLAIAGLILGLLSIAGWSAAGGMLAVGYVQSKPAAAVARQFLQDMSGGNVPAATANAVGITQADLQTQAAKMAPFGSFQSASISSFNYSIMNGQTTLKLGGTATFSSATKSCAFTMVKVAGAYKVNSFSLK